MNNATSESTKGFNKQVATIALNHWMVDGSDEKNLVYMIDKVVEIVTNRHYSKYAELMLEFRSVVYIKVFKVISHFNPTKDIFTFLYTIARNEIHNYLYHKNKDRVLVGLDDMETTDTELDLNYEISHDIQVEHWMEDYFPSNRYLLGEKMIEYMSLLNELKENSEQISILEEEDDIHRFLIFSYFYLQSDVFLYLHAYHELSKTTSDFGSMIVALAGIHIKMPNTRKIREMVDMYKKFVSNRVSISKGQIPPIFLTFRNILAEYEITLKQVLQYMDGDIPMDDTLFSKSQEYKE